MLHLEARVHLQEVEVAVRVRQEFHGARAHIIHRARHLQRGLAHGFAHLGRHMGRRCLLDDLLVAALHGTLALPEVDMVAVLVTEDLDLDVAGLENGLFHIDRIIAEG